MRKTRRYSPLPDIYWRTDSEERSQSHCSICNRYSGKFLLIYDSVITIVITVWCDSQDQTRECLITSIQGFQATRSAFKKRGVLALPTFFNAFWSVWICVMAKVFAKAQNHVRLFSGLWNFSKIFRRILIA